MISHTHIGAQKCILNDCDIKDCSTLCDLPNGLGIDGHNTHKPPIGRFARFISEEDTNGNKKAQYFVPVNKKSEITEQEKQQYNKDLKTDVKTENYFQKYKDKYLF